MENLLIEFQNRLLDSSNAVSELLRKAYVIAKDLNQDIVLSWVELELNGYGIKAKSQSIPEYRKVTEPINTMLEGFGWAHLEGDENNPSALILQSIPELELMIKTNCDNEIEIETGIKIPVRLAHRVIEAVRLKLLEWSTGLKSKIQSSSLGIAGWERVNRGVQAFKDRLKTAEIEEEWQAVGLLCRETLISLAQAVYDPKRHRSLDGIEPSETDAKRMLESYIAVELAGSSNEIMRKYARSSLDLANQLQHDRTATYRDAVMCVEATIGVINLIAIISSQGHLNNTIQDRPIYTMHQKDMKDT